MTLLIANVVARIVHFLKLRLVGKKIAEASAIDDGNVFGKVKTTGAEVEKALTGRKVSLPFILTRHRQPATNIQARSSQLEVRGNIFGR